MLKVSTNIAGDYIFKERIQRMKMDRKITNEV